VGVDDGLDNGADNSENPLLWSTDGPDSDIITDNNFFGNVPVTITEQGPNSGVFGSYDESDESVIKITSNAKRGTSATIDYNETPTTVLVGFQTANIDIQPTDDEWNSGEEIPIVLVDGDANKNSRADEDLDLFNPNVDLLPALVTGDPFTLGEGSNATTAIYFDASIDPSTTLVTGSSATANVTVTSFSKIGRVNATEDPDANTSYDSILIDFQTTMGELRQSIGDTRTAASDRLHGFNLLNLDVRSFNNTGTFNVYLLNSSSNIIVGSDLVGDVGSLVLASGVTPQSLTSLNGTGANNTGQLITSALFDTTTTPDANRVGVLIQHVGDTTNTIAAADDVDPIAVDFFTFGFKNDGLEKDERIANQIIRLELEESGDNTSTFEGTLEYIMINQLNILDASTYTSMSTIANDPTFIVIEDLDDEESPRVNYNDLGQDGVITSS
jgi:hypothetical protein